MAVTPVPRRRRASSRVKRMLQSSERTVGFHGSESLRQLQIVEIHRGALMRGRCGADDPRRRRGHVAQSPGRDEIGHVIERKRGFEPILGLLLSLGLFSAASWASVTGDIGHWRGQSRIPKVGRERRALRLSSGRIRFAVAPQAQISSLPRAFLLRGYRHACGSERFEFGIRADRTGMRHCHGWPSHHRNGGTRAPDAIHWS